MTTPTTPTTPGTAHRVRFRAAGPAHPHDVIAECSDGACAQRPGGAYRTRLQKAAGYGWQDFQRFTLQHNGIGDHVAGLDAAAEAREIAELLANQAERDLKLHQRLSALTMVLDAGTEIAAEIRTLAQWLIIQADDKPRAEDWQMAVMADGSTRAQKMMRLAALILIGDPS